MVDATVSRADDSIFLGFFFVAKFKSWFQLGE